MKRENALDAPMRAAILSVAIVGVTLSLLAAVTYGLSAALSVLAGGAMATVNLWVLAELVRAFLSPSGNKGPWVALALLKLTALFGGVYLLVTKQYVSILGLAIGFAALPIGITLGTVMGPKPGEDGGKNEPDDDREN